MIEADGKVDSGSDSAQANEPDPAFAGELHQTSTAVSGGGGPKDEVHSVPLLPVEDTEILKIAIETDVGHDCDDIEALQVALKDHKLGRVKIVYISTVSRNNVARAGIVQHLCAALRIADIPIIPSRREQAHKDGQPLDRCTPVFSFVKVGPAYVVDPRRQTIRDVHGPIPLCPILPQSQSVELKQKLLREAGNVRVLIIGPGVESETFTSLVDRNLPREQQAAEIRTIVSRVVFQGNYDDKASFNIGCDFEPVAEVQEWAAAFSVPLYNIGKLVAYNTQLNMHAFKRLADCAFTCGNIDLQKLWQLGVMEFRDANRNLFNQLNFHVSEPGKQAFKFIKGAVTYDDSNPQHKKLYDVLTEDSYNTSWFNALSCVPPMYDVTAYFLCRDAHNEPIETPSETPSGSAAEGPEGPEGLEGIDNDGCKWFTMTKHSPTRFSVGAKSPDIKPEKSLYLSMIEEELMEAMHLIEPAMNADLTPSEQAEAEAEAE